MVKPVWVAVAFVAGIVLGVAAVHLSRDEAPATPAAVPLAGSVQERRPSEASVPSEAHPASQVSLPVAPASSAVPHDPRAPQAPVASQLPGLADAAPAGNAGNGTDPFPALPPDDGSPVAQPIDVGEPFRADMSKISAAGDTIADAHRALEREVRDDSWAYQRESDIQNVLIPETGAGNFKAHYVECRATMCEVRLSAQNATQAESLRVWADELSRRPWASDLFPTYSTSITKDGKTDRLIIFRRPKKP